MSQAAFTLKGRNPDVLSCIANLSNDEVFTPPEFANRMLDTLTEAWAADHNGGSIWANPDLTFLDPCTKSGVFLREITKRLIDGLEAQIPELQTRVDHILSRQVFGIGITELTAMLARRSAQLQRLVADFPDKGIVILDGIEPHYAYRQQILALVRTQPWEAVDRRGRYTGVEEREGITMITPR